ncbi:hypothetical protein AHF37_09720 [Paragonimus kellicotti]|nr:hypothetical protein AHF37_09720 [Paragonimus kellicotti]
MLFTLSDPIPFGHDGDVPKWFEDKVEAPYPVAEESDRTTGEFVGPHCYSVFIVTKFTSSSCLSTAVSRLVRWRRKTNLSTT